MPTKKKATGKKGTKGDATDQAPGPVKTERAGKIHRRELTMQFREGKAPDEQQPYIDASIKHRRQVVELQIEAAEVASGYRKKIKEEQASMDEALAVLSQGHLVPKRVEEIKNFETKKVKYVDLETKRVLQERDMNKDDGQMNIEETADAAGDGEGAPALT